MVGWEIKYTRKAKKDAQRLRDANLANKARVILDAIRADPFGYPPPFEKLTADLKGAYSRRINIQHRIVYKIDSESRVVVVCGMFSHYEE